MQNPKSVAITTQVLGDKWTPMIICALSASKLRFCELQTNSGGINPRTLSARLEMLESSEIITKTAFAQVPPRVEYCLTEKGRRLLPIIREMAKWGNNYPAIIKN